jgi:hypothetical protein
MEALKKKYIVDENQKKVAVQIGIKDFEKMERVIEDYALGKLIEENNPDDYLSLDDAISEYEKLKKAQ